MEHLTPKGRSGIVVPEGIIFQSGTAYKSLRKSLVEKYLVGVISLPSGVFQPYSGVKTSILILDKELSPKTDKIFFGKVDNDGFDLGSQRREIEKNDLPKITKDVTEYLEGLRNGKIVESEYLNYVRKEQILNSSDIGLSYERYSVKKVLNSSYELSKQLMDALSLKTPREHYDQLKLEGDIFLKIDTEGAEYDYIISEDIDDLASFTVGLILEVHWIDQPQNQIKFIEMMEKLNKHFILTHVHGNNWGGEFIYEGCTLPKVPEFTFVNKKYVSKYQPDTQTYPIAELDFPNNPHLPECNLDFLKTL
jgi:hypothetical protein